MIIKVVIPDTMCIHNRELVRNYLSENGINVQKKVLLFRDFETGKYIFKQDVESDSECDFAY